MFALASIIIGELISVVSCLAWSGVTLTSKSSADCDRIKFELTTSQSGFNTINREYEIALSKLNDSDAAMTGLAEQLAVAGQNVKNTGEELDRLISALDAANEQRTFDERDLAAAIAQFESHQTPLEPDLTHLEDLRSQVSSARSKEVEARLSLRTIEERRDAIAQRAIALENQASAERDAASKSISRRENRAQAAITAQEIADTAYEALIQIESSISKAGAERERLEKSRSDREGEILSLRTIGRELAIELERLTSSVHKDEIARAEQRLRIEQLESKAVEELGVDVSTLLTEYGPSNDVPTFYENEQGEFVPGDLIPYRRDQQEKRLAQAERSLTLLGKINPLALEEYSSLEERLRYLAEQLEDLKKTKKDLLDIIKEVDDRVQQIFTQAYEDTAREFELVFARLFPGCRLLDIHEYLMEKGIKMEGVSGTRYMYHDPCHSPMKTYAPSKVTNALMNTNVPLNDRCCGESGTFAVGRPDIATQVKKRKQEEIEKGIQKMGEDQPEALGEVKILTSCPSCLQGLARYGEDTNTTADYIVVELAKNLLGANWMQNYVESSTKGGIEKILL